MKVSEIIAIADAIKENEVGDEIKLRSISEVEGRVFCEIRSGIAETFRPFTSLEADLSVPMPYSRMYVLYLLAAITFSRGEFDAYTALTLEYERAFEEYARYCIRCR